MYHTARRCAVFTPAFPNLEAFLRHHIDPNHPLRHHPLWLAEEDMKNLKVDCSASRRNQTGNPPTVVMTVPHTLSLWNMDQIMPESEICWQLPHVDVPMSIANRIPYNRSVKEDLQRFKELHGFHSNWWGSLSQWRAKGAHTKPGKFPVAVKVNRTSTLLHISLVSNAQEVLKHSYVSGKSGFFSTWFNLEAPQEKNGFVELVSAHVGTHGFQTPLYFPASSLQSAGIGIQPGADPLDLSTWLPNDNETLSMSDGFPCSCGFAAYEQFYHLSQVIFPDGYEMPIVVQDAERLHPGVPVNGMTGQLLRRSELHYDALLRSHVPELAALLRDDGSGKASGADLSSPRDVEGRHLWFRPSDVLELGGMIDVNSMPVEVPIQAQKRYGNRQLYNVDQLLVPTEGYKAVGSVKLFAQQIPERTPEV